MFVENTQTAMRIWVRNLISTIVLIVAIIIFYMADVLEEPVFGISRLEVSISLCVAYLYIIFYPIVLKYQFVYISHEENKISVKYFTIGFIPGARKSFEFPASEFHKFEVKKTLFKLRESIVLFRKIKKGIAKYPPISLTGLKEKQRNQVITLFSGLARTSK